MSRAVEPVEPSAAPRPILLSLRPRYAQAILDGAKTVELRRTRISAPDGTLVILYATAPIRSVVGTTKLAGRFIGTPVQVWTYCGSRTGLTKREYDDYFRGADLATALLLAAPRPLDAWHSLAELRESQPSFRPPQSFRYVADQDPVLLHGLGNHASPANVHKPRAR